jgi:2'-deoxynucleoside 5'-phosphate N-hydrolase
MYFDLIEEIQKHATVLTEHLGNKALSSYGEVERTDQDIYTRDMEWVREADAVIAEVSTPSLGVGYELGQAEAMGKPILCLYRPQDGKRLSAMLAGNAYLTVATYTNIPEASEAVRSFLQSLVG